MRKNTPAPEKRFDESMAELEALVGRLERGDLPLEDALGAYEQGIGLVKLLSQRLSEAESRVEVLTRNVRGELERQPLLSDAEDKPE